MNFVFTPALNLTFSPRRRNSHRTFLTLRMTVLQIQSHEFLRRRRTIPPLLGERAGARADVLSVTCFAPIAVFFSLFSRADVRVKVVTEIRVSAA